MKLLLRYPQWVATYQVQERKRYITYKCMTIGQATALARNLADRMAYKGWQFISITPREGNHAS